MTEAPEAALSNLQLTVVGSLNIDITARVASLPTPGETIGNGQLSREPGGKGANQAVAASRLGATVRMIGAVGDDEAGGLLIDTLTAANVDVAAIHVVDAATGTALITVDREGENQIAVCPGANHTLTVDPAQLKDTTCVLVQLEIPLSVVRDVSTAAPGFLAINAAPATTLPAEIIDRADLIIVNDSEAQQLPEVHRAELLAITHGAGGATLYREGVEIAHTPGRHATVRNTVGAGDAFCAALTIALASGVDAAEALTVAAEIGAAAVEDVHSQPKLSKWDRYRTLPTDEIPLQV
jgi:ribokinase